MLTHRPITMSIALMLAAGAVVAVAASGTPAGGAGSRVPAPPAPLLGVRAPAELRTAEAQERAAFGYRQPRSVRYSNAEMNAFVRAGRAEP